MLQSIAGKWLMIIVTGPPKTSDGFGKQPEKSGD